MYPSPRTRTRKLASAQKTFMTGFPLYLPEVTSILFLVEIIFNSFSTYIGIPKPHDLGLLVLELYINEIVLYMFFCDLFLLIWYL